MENTTVETATSTIKITTSQQWLLNLQDIGKGFLVAFLSALTTGLYQFIASALETGNALQLPTANDLKTIGYVALFAGLGYLVKNWITPAQTIIRETKK